MQEGRLKERFVKLVSITSPSRAEKKMADFCQAFLEELGAYCERDNAQVVTGGDCGNLVAYLPGDADGLVAFSAHLDTVVPCDDIEVGFKTIEDDKGELTEIAYALTDTILSSDDKAGIAAIFEGIVRAREKGLRMPSVLVILSVCEEQSVLGAGALEKSFVESVIAHAQAHAEARAQSAVADIAGRDLKLLAHSPLPCFVLDADGQPGTVVASAPRHMTFKATFHGIAAHAGMMPEAGVSAIVMAARALCRMKLGRIDEATTANVGMIYGGAAVNIVADTCTLEGECRSIYPKRAEACAHAMDEAMRSSAADAGGSVDINWNIDYDAVLYEEGHPLLEKLKEIAASAGLEFKAVHCGGGSDANALSKKGFDAIALGMGMTNPHSTDEFIALRDLEGSARFVEAIIASYAR